MLSENLHKVLILLVDKSTASITDIVIHPISINYKSDEDRGWAWVLFLLFSILVATG